MLTLRRQPSRRRASVRTAHAGFTLLEVLIAVALLGIALIPLLGGMNVSLNLAYSAKMKTIATLLARERMTRVELAGFPELGDTEGDFGENAAAFAWRQSVVEPPPGLDASTVREVRLWVVWKEGSAVRDYQLTNFVVDRNAADQPADPNQNPPDS
ncbi:MAG: prepilin-type N-terminal cleavage/methylation domain-containing protein [bacterium]